MLAAIGPGPVAMGSGQDGPVASASGKRVVFPARCGGRKTRPSTIVMACGDAGFIIESISWSGWGRGTTSGVGTGVTKTCVPSCAAGGIEKHPISLVLFRKVRCKDGPSQYTRLSYHFTDSGPSLGPTSNIQRFPCNYFR